MTDTVHADIDSQSQAFEDVRIFYLVPFSRVYGYIYFRLDRQPNGLFEVFQGVCSLVPRQIKAEYILVFETLEKVNSFDCFCYLRQDMIRTSI